MRSPLFVSSLSLLALAGCGLTADDLAPYEATDADFETRIASLEASLAQTQTDLEAAEATLDILQTELGAAQAELATAQSDLATTQGDLATVDATVGTLVTDLDAAETTLEEHGTTLVDHTSSLAELGTSVADLALSVGLNQTNIAANADDIDLNADAIDDLEDLAADLEADFALSLAVIDTRVTANEDDIADNADDIELAIDSIDQNSSDIAANTDDVQLAFEAIDDNTELLDDSFAGMYPALYSFDRADTSSTIPFLDVESNGLSLYTSGGAFTLGGYYSISNTQKYHYVTFYVTNPTTASKAVSLRVCGSDSNAGYLDGTQVWTAGDDDGRCGLTWSLTLTPGDHVVRLRTFDNNGLERLGVRTNWIEANGLEIDWDSMKDAMSGAL